MPGQRAIPYVLGVDAGGTKTLALLAGLDGAIIRRGESGPGNYQAVGAQPALDAVGAAIAAAVASASADAGLNPAQSHLAGLCLGMAGVDRPDDRALVADWAARTFPGVPLVIANDAQLVLAAGALAAGAPAAGAPAAGAPAAGTNLADTRGIAVISGTGSMVYAADGHGQSARAGGWGYLLGDEGSGYAVGLAGLRAVARAHDGRAPATRLTAAVLAHFGLPNPNGLIERVYRAGLTRPEIARLSILVDEAAAQHDPAALEIMAQAADELALAARAAAEKLKLAQPIPCALAGGMFTKGQSLLPAFRAAAQRAGLALDPLALVDEPARGAVKLALRVVQ